MKIRLVLEWLVLMLELGVILSLSLSSARSVSKIDLLQADMLTY